MLSMVCSVAQSFLYCDCDGDMMFITLLSNADNVMFVCQLPQDF